MKFYKIGKAWQPEIIGVKNGISQAEMRREGFIRSEDYQEILDFFDSRAYWKRDIRKPPREFLFEYIQIQKKAKVTDLLSFSPHLIGVDFILNSKARRLLDGLDLRNSHFFDARVFSSEEKLIEDQHTVLYTNYLDFELVEFKKSIFYSGDDRLGDKRYHNFKTLGDWDDYWDKPNHEFVKAEKIVVRGQDNPDYVKTRLGGPFISERLLDRWMSFDISGFVLLNDQQIEFV